MAVLSTEGNGTFHIKKILLDTAAAADDSEPSAGNMKLLVTRVMKETDKGKSVEAIARSCKINQELAAQICRLYLTHPGVSADGILGKMGL